MRNTNGKKPEASMWRIFCTIFPGTSGGIQSAMFAQVHSAKRYNSPEKGEFYGEELRDWVLKTCLAPTLSNPTISTKTVQAETKVEVFALKANDLKHVVSKFWWLFSMELRNSNSFGLRQ
ncbi:unnamed protein product [Prunus brigantina]